MPAANLGAGAMPRTHLLISVFGVLVKRESKKKLAGLRSTFSPPRLAGSKASLWYCNIAGDIRYLGHGVVVVTIVLVAATRSDTGASRYSLVAGLKQRCWPRCILLIEYRAVMTRKEG
jgi:hypothetical protein